jgi:TM2 domain-containing membrane protein YozV
MSTNAVRCGTCGARRYDYANLPTPATNGTSATSSRTKLVLALLWLLLPGTGAQRFYLGHVGLGVAQLLVTVFTLGLGIVWPLIDGVVLLATTPIDASGLPVDHWISPRATRVATHAARNQPDARASELAELDSQGGVWLAVGLIGWLCGLTIFTGPLGWLFTARLREDAFALGMPAPGVVNAAWTVSIISTVVTYALLLLVGSFFVTLVASSV